jgi:tRNA(Ile)-lysidine synthase
MKTKFFNILRDDFNFQSTKQSDEKLKILVGVSGGADSIFLLYLLNAVKTDFNFEIFVAHVNHNLRGEESLQDSIFVENLCKNLGVTCILKNITIESKNGIEEKARKARYKIFEDICKDYGIKYCALAHNADDNIETILMWLIRGTGLLGAEGIPKTRFLDYSKKLVLIRPVLSFFKNEILDFLNNNNISFRVDSSNKSNIFLRNKLRNELVPILEKYNPKFKKHVLNFSNIIAENNVFVDEILKPYLNDVILNFSEQNLDENIVIDLAKYIGYNVAVQKNILIYALKNKANSYQINKLFELIQKDKNKNFELPLKSKFLALKEYGFLTIKKTYKPVDLAFQDFASLNLLLRGALATWQSNQSDTFPHYVHNDKIEIFEIKKISEIENIKDKNIAFLDYDLIKNKDLVFRFRKDGDIFKPFGMTGHKTLKEFFIDEKIPISKRNKIILLAEKNEILWVSGYRLSEDFKVLENTKRVLKIKLKVF